MCNDLSDLGESPQTMIIIHLNSLILDCQFENSNELTIDSVFIIKIINFYSNYSVHWLNWF